jgi:prevent-host-death family protein
MRVGIRQLKNGDLSRAIRRAQRGEEVIVTDRGVPIVRIVPANDAGLTPSIQELAAKGLIEIHAPTWEELSQPVSLRAGSKSAVAYVEEQRR